jgi:Outer membrane protein beta-barrel domain
MRLVRIGVVFGIAMLCAVSSWASGGEIAAGYSYLNDNDISQSFPAGWFVSAAANFTNMFAIVGDVSGNYKSESSSSGGATATASLKVHTFQAGPRVRVGSSAVTVFAQVLVGAATVSAGVNASGTGVSLSVSASDTELCYQPGTGVDIGLSRGAAIRLGANERFIHSDGNTSKEFQFVAGLVLRFGR